MIYIITYCTCQIKLVYFTFHHQIKERPGAGVFVKDITSVPVSSADDISRRLQQALHNSNEFSFIFVSKRRTQFPLAYEQHM